MVSENSPKTLFREYFRRRLISAGKKLAGDELEDFIAEAAAEWEREPCAEYGGLSPKEYFADIGDAAELIRLLAADIKEGGEPLAVITDRLAELPGAAVSLAETVCSDEADEELRIVAADLLNYRNPLIMDMPEIHLHVADNYEPRSANGTKSVGELGIIPVAPAIREAVVRASGQEVTQLPLSRQFFVKNCRYDDFFEGGIEKC